MISWTPPYGATWHCKASGERYETVNDMNIACNNCPCQRDPVKGCCGAGYGPGGYYD